MISIYNFSFLKYTLLFLTIYLSGGCRQTPTEKEKKILASLKKISGKELNMGKDSIFQRRNPKIITVIPDTGECTLCKMQVYDWYLYKLDLDNNHILCDIIYILPDSIRLVQNVEQMLSYYRLYYVKGAEMFIRKNSLAGFPFDTFLTDSLNRVILAGTPLQNKKMWNLYKKVLNSTAE